jgi:glycine hydroxymethyltransferase
LILSKGTVSNPLKRPDKTLENLPTLIDRAVFPGTQGGPHMHTIAAKAVAFHEALQPAFREYAEQIVKNAAALAETLQAGGLQLISGGTSNHLILADVHGSFGIDGREAQQRLERIGMTANANAIPYDTLPPFRPSGLRLGAPAVTTRGMREDDMQRIGEMIITILTTDDPTNIQDSLRIQVSELIQSFPLPY